MGRGERKGEVVRLEEGGRAREGRKKIKEEEGRGKRNGSVTMATTVL